MMDTYMPFFTHKKNMASPANSFSAAADVDDVPFSRTASFANSISTAANVDDVPFSGTASSANSASAISGTCLVFTICVVDALKVEGVTNRFLSFVNEEGETIKQEFGSVSIARGVQGDNPYATITENRSVILKQRERIKFLLRALNDILDLYPSTSPPIADFILSILLSDDHDDDDDDDNDVDDLGRLHDDDNNNNDDDDDDDHLRRH